MIWLIPILAVCALAIGVEMWYEHKHGDEVSDDVTPFPKPQKRIRATPQEWEAIAEAKQGPCRICRRVESNGSVHSKIELHHLIRRSQGGDDVAENIVPLCGDCHRRLHDGRLVALRLEPAEKAYLRSRGRA